MSWQALSPEDQVSHPLYGFGGWLIPIFAVMLGLSLLFLALTTHSTALTWAIAEYGETLGRPFAERFHLWSVVASAVWAGLLCMAMRHSRLFPTATLALMWPLLLWSNGLNLPLLGITRTLINFGIWAVVPIAITVYLLISRRVNVTYRQRQQG